MPANPTAEFERHYHVVRTRVRITDDDNLFDVVITGPEDMVEEYLRDGLPLHVKLVPPGTATKALEEFLKELGMDIHPVRRAEKQVEPELSPEDPRRTMEVEIIVVQTPLEKYDLLLAEDPTLPPGGKRDYEVYGRPYAWAVCTIKIGNVDLYLYEQQAGGSWDLRDSSCNPGDETEVVEAKRQDTGTWRLRVRALQESTYQLYGTFNETAP